MPTAVLPGEIWRVDLGLAAKVRPALILSDYPADEELALVVVIPHTTAVRGNRWEFPVRLPFLETGVFHLQQIQPVSLARIDRRLGLLPPAQFTELRRAMVRLLHLDA
jgi:mRNA interferase MazF